MPYTLADLDAIYREPQPEPQPEYLPPTQLQLSDLLKPGDTMDSLEQDLDALQETLDKDMLEMEQNSAGGIMPPQVMEEESLELQEIMVDNVVASEVTLEDDVFDRLEILDDDPPDNLKDDFD